MVLTDVNDQEPVFDPNSLLAAVAEEAEFDTTVTVLKARTTHPLFILPQLECGSIHVRAGCY